MTNARAVLLVGADALEWGAGTRAYTWTDPRSGRKIHEPGIMQYHGSVFTGREARGMHYALKGAVSGLPPMAHTVIASLHPAFAMRGQPRFMVEILTNIRRAVAAANGPAPRPRAERQRIIFNPPPEEIFHGPQTVLDIETPEDASSRIEICCVTETPTRVRVFDWTPRYAEVVRRIVADKKIIKIGHNIGYDVAAWLDNGLEVNDPILDTIIAAARLWPPMPQKKLNEVASKDRIPVRWLSLDRVALRLLGDIVYWKRWESRATQAFFAVAFPNVPPAMYRYLYNGLDGIYNHRAWLILRELLKQKGLLERVAQIDMQAFLPMVNMERRGVLVDENRRAQLKQECEQTKAEAEQRIGEIAQRFHEKRRRIVDADAAVGRAKLTTEGWAACEKHPDYVGLTKRTKDPCCAAVYEAAVVARGALKDVKTKLKRSKTIAENIGEKFDPAKPDHWRWLLFDKDGLNSEREKADWIKPVAWTPKKREPQIDADSMERLQKKYPGVELFRLKVDVTYAEWRLNNTLAVEVDGEGYAHTKLSIHRASTARYSSGTDREDSEKIRFAAAGNQQNIPDADRSIYIAPDGWLIMAPDYSQIEARVTAWRAREYRLLDAWKRGEDIHTNNAIILAAAIGVKLRPEDARELVFPFDPQRKSYRDNGKILTHAWDYGMDVGKTSRDFGLPFAVAQKLLAGYFEAYPRLAQRIRDVEAEALEKKWLRNSFGLLLGPYEREKVKGAWRLKDRNEALAAQPQSDVGDMMKVVSKELDNWTNRGYNTPSLRTTMHDNFWIYVKAEDVTVVGYRVKNIMQRDWPELGPSPGYGIFSCPVELSVGKNGGKAHVHGEKCIARGCTATENPNGLVKVG
jgi:DNA polymerase I-like protein with 3'-5' exonuclease and polymerase domains